MAGHICFWGDFLAGMFLLVLIVVIDLTRSHICGGDGAPIVD